MKPYFSLIIPYYNSSETIGPLLSSIARSKHAPPLEVIVVDDGSKKAVSFQQAAVRQMQKNSFKRHFLLKLKIRAVRLTRHRGPAGARNRGAKLARGQFLVFLDSDVVLFPDALHNLWKIYRDDPDITAVTGVWVKDQHSHAFFPNYKALRDWSYWINERDRNGYYYLFSTRIASIKRSVFLRLKGFDESYKAPLIEDIEFTYRIARRYAIIFAPDVRVRHEFGGFASIAKKYFWRSYWWTQLYGKRKKFDPVATTLTEALTALSGAGVAGMTGCILFLICVGLVIPIDNPVVQTSLFYCYIVTLLCTSLHLFCTRTFLIFSYREKGLWFALRAFATGLILSLIITAGAGWGRVKQLIIDN